MISYLLYRFQVAQVCNICDETLPDPKALVEHKRSQHSNDICYVCAKSFLCLSDLNLHISRMHPEMSDANLDPNDHVVKVAMVKEKASKGGLATKKDPHVSKVSQ